MSAKKHIKELQWRFMLIAVFFVVGATLAYAYSSQLIPALLEPLNGQKLIYLNPAGGFSFILLVSIYAGIAVAFPILMQQLYAFLSPVLPENARKKSSVIIVSSFLLLVAGVAFGYFVAVPSALTFLYGFADQYVEASLTAESYLNFIIAYTIGIGIVFQLPLLLLLIHSVKPLSPGGLLRSEKWVVLIAFILAAIITPTPDPINQAIIAGPVIVVYQFGVIAILFALYRSSRLNKKTVKAERADLLRPVAFPLPVPETSFQPIVQQHQQARTQNIQHASHVTPTITNKKARSIDGFARQPLRTPAVPLHRPAAKTPGVHQPKKFSVDGMVTPRRVATGF